MLTSVLFILEAKVKPILPASIYFDNIVRGCGAYICVASLCGSISLWLSSLAHTNETNKTNKSTERSKYFCGFSTHPNHVWVCLYIISQAVQAQSQFQANTIYLIIIESFVKINGSARAANRLEIANLLAFFSSLHCIQCLHFDSRQLIKFQIREREEEKN